MFGELKYFPYICNVKLKIKCLTKKKRKCQKHRIM